MKQAKNKTQFNIALIILLMVGMGIVSCQNDPVVQKPSPTPVVKKEVCDPQKVYFVNDILPIIQNNCAYSGCHDSQSKQDNVNLTNYDNIIRTGEVVAFDLNESELYEVLIENDPSEIMPPPPANPLNASQIKLIAQWINQGALNNECNECTTTDITFSKTISPIIVNNCQSCHSGGTPSGGISLTNHEQINLQAQSGALYGVVSHQANYSAMPPTQKLNDCLINQIRLWVDAGALDN